MSGFCNQKNTFFILPTARLALTFNKLGYGSGEQSKKIWTFKIEMRYSLQTLQKNKGEATASPKD